MRLTLQGLTDFGPLVCLLDRVPSPQPPVSIEAKHDDFGSELGCTRRNNDRRYALDLLRHTGLLQLARPSHPLRLAPAGLDHLPHDCAALVGRRAGPSCGLS